MAAASCERELWELHSPIFAEDGHGCICRPQDAQPRRFSHGSYIRQGGTAGCGLASALIRAYCIEPLDDFCAQVGKDIPQTVKLEVFVDDLMAGATGTAAQVIDAIDTTAAILHDIVQRDLQCTIELSKAAVVASTPEITRALTIRLGELAGPKRVRTAPSLGIDVAAGRKRRTQRGVGRRAARFLGLRRKMRRMRALRKVVGRKAARVFTAGPLPYATYGAEVNGTGNAEALTLRRAAAAAFSPRARGLSLTILTLLEQAPTWKAEVAPVIKYAQVVWDASVRSPAAAADGEITLAEVSRSWNSVDFRPLRDEATGKNRWDQVCGPIGAMWLSIRRLGWHMLDPFTFVDDRGYMIQLTLYSPALDSAMLHDAVCRQMERSIASRIINTNARGSSDVHRPQRSSKFCTAVGPSGDEPIPTRRICMDHIRDQLANDKWWDAERRAAYRAVLCNAVMTYSRAVEGGYLVEDRCPMCGMLGDTLHHRIWACKHPDAVAAREATAPAWLRLEANTAGQGDDTFTTAFIPHPGDIIHHPSDKPTAHWYDGDSTGGFAQGDRWTLDGREVVNPRDIFGCLYVDGSCTTQAIKELRRAAAAVITRVPNGTVGSRVLIPVYAPLPQTPQAAEHLAAAFAYRAVGHGVADGGATIGTDCSGVIRVIHGGTPAMTSRRRMYAGLLREVWSNRARAEQISMFKIRSHQIDHGVEAVPEGLDREHAIGNAEADLAAKEALKLHPTADRNRSDVVEALIMRARLIARTIANVMIVFPPMPSDNRMQRMPPLKDGAMLRGQGGPHLGVPLRGLEVHHLPQDGLRRCGHHRLRDAFAMPRAEGLFGNTNHAR